MYRNIAETFQQIPFFHSVAFGIIAMAIVGASWCLVGLVMGDAPKKGIEASLVQFFGALVSTAASLIVLFATSAHSAATGRATALACLIYFAAFMVNFVMLQLMSKAMQCGPNGIIWAIIQSALVFPFLGGILFFDVRFTPLRGIGIALLLGALALFAAAGNNRTSGAGPRWKILAFSAMTLAAIQQNLATMPSYFEELRGVPSVMRALAASGGTMFMAVVWNLFSGDREQWRRIRSGICSRTLWKYVVALQFFGLAFAYTLFYPGMDVMAKAGLGGMCYPMMVGSCIVSFTLSSVFLLREKMGGVQLFALITCIAGLVFLCTK